MPFSQFLENLVFHVCLFFTYGYLSLSAQLKGGKSYKQYQLCVMNMKEGHGKASYHLSA